MFDVVFMSEVIFTFQVISFYESKTTRRYRYQFELRVWNQYNKKPNILVVNEILKSASVSVENPDIGIGIYVQASLSEFFLYS